VRDWSDGCGVSNARDERAEGTSPSVCAQALDDGADAIGCGTVPRASGSPVKGTNVIDGDWDREKSARSGIEIFSVSESKEKPEVRSFRTIKCWSGRKRRPITSWFSMTVRRYTSVGYAVKTSPTSRPHKSYARSRRRPSR